MLEHLRSVTQNIVKKIVSTSSIFSFVTGEKLSSIYKYFINSFGVYSKLK